MNMASLVFLIFSACVCSFVFVHATDPEPLQDFCVADLQNPVFVNGFVCKDPRQVKSTDFVYRGLRQPGNTNNSVSGLVTTAFVDAFPGINTQGISIVRIDIAPGGQNRPHHHPRASEILVVIKGKLLVGFITTNPNNILYSTTLEEGDVFVFPRGLLHFQQNVGKGPALAFAALNSQNPGVLTEANAIFGANPSVPAYILARAFKLAEEVVDELQAEFLALGGNP